MGFFDDEKNVDEYISIAQGYDGKELILILKEYLPEGSSVLELGMGPGVDLDIMNNFFKTTGSDNSDTFLNRYKNSHPGSDILNLDAVKLNTERIFDSIYSNKVLHHISEDDLRSSYDRQKSVVKENGIILHAFWKGDRRLEKYSGLSFYYYQPEDMETIAGEYFEIINTAVYSEMDENDSFYIVMKNSRKEK